MLTNKPVKYLGFGSPLMDAIGEVTEEMIKKHDLKLDSTIHSKVQETEIFPAFINECAVNYVPGGCSYNTMRVLNWMLEHKTDEDVTGLLGSVGNDMYGELYQDLLKKEDILPLFESFDKIITGMCLVFCKDRDRGHVTDLGASILISKEFVQRIWKEIRQAKLIYTELFILKHKREIVYMLAELSLQDGKCFGFNLPSFYFLENYFEDIKTLIEYADVIFANAAEARFFGNLLNIPSDEFDFSSLCLELCRLPKKNTKKRRIVVITCGPNPAHICEYDFTTNSITYINKFAPIMVEEDKIVDTNAAGDAFAGGFLARLMKNQPLDECMKAGHKAASIIIQVRGCEIPEKISMY